MTQHHDYWDEFYLSRASNEVPDAPSTFAQWVSDRIEPDAPIIEFGFGNARDALWFADQGRAVRGYDFAESAVESGRSRACERGVDAQFSVLDLYDREAVALVAKELKEKSVACAVYARFLIHSLEPQGRHHLLELAAAVLDEGGSLFLEFRTGQDRLGTHLFGDSHYRNYVDSSLVAREVENLGGAITDREAGHGLAIYKSEDPHVARLRASWN